MMLAFILAVTFLLLFGVWNLLLLQAMGREKARNWRRGLKSVEGFLLAPEVY